jgi:hypothetical protein
VYKILVAKYFPHTSFLEAFVSGNASIIWQNVCDSKDVLSMGLRWRVSMGEKN